MIDLVMCSAVPLAIGTYVAKGLGDSLFQPPSG
jgi:hypothetical protein